MECKTSSGQSTLGPGSFYESKMPHKLSYPLTEEEGETKNPDSVEPEAVETVTVKLEVVDEEDDDGDDVSHGKLSATHMSVNVNGGLSRVNFSPEAFIQADSDTGSCPSYGDPTSGTSYRLGVPSIDRLEEEKLFTYETPTGAEERDPLADPSPGSLARLRLRLRHPSNSDESLDSGRSGILNDKPTSLTQIPKTAANSTTINRGAAKLPLEGIKSAVRMEPLNPYRQVPVQEPDTSSVQNCSTTISEPLRRRLQLITQERLKGLMTGGFVTVEAVAPTSAEAVPPTSTEAVPPTSTEAVPPTSTVALPGTRERQPRPPTTKMKRAATKSKACQTLNVQEKEFLTKMFEPSNRCPTLFYNKHQLDQHTKSIIYHVANYFQDKKKTFSLNYNVAAVASGATSLPQKTVQNIIGMGRRSLEDDKTLKVPTFGRYHTEKCEHCGDALVDLAIREIIFNGYVQKGRAQTIKEISACLDADEIYVCEEFLRRRLGELGIDLMRCIATSGYIPLERPELTASRYRYFQDIEKHRLLRKQIVYVFEVDLSKVFHGKVTWEPVDGHPTKDDSHLMTVIHGARESGFIDGTLFVHLDSSRHHRKSMHPLTVFWLNSFLPKLSRGSVVVLGHNRHHFVRPAVPKPDASWAKQDIVDWLHEHQKESFSSSLPSAVLLEKVNTVDVGTTFGIDDLVLSHGHTPLHLPQNHRELNPIELVWRKILGKFPSTVGIEKEGHMKAFLQKEFDSVSPSELQEAFELCKNHENRLRHFDMRIDGPVGEVIRHAGGILGRNYAVAEDESVDEDASIRPVLGRLIEKNDVRSSDRSRKKSRNDETSSIQPGKKKRTSWGEAAIGANDQIPQLMLQTRTSSIRDCQEISTPDIWGNSQARDLGGKLIVSDDTSLVQLKEGGTSPTAEVDCVVGSNGRKAQPTPKHSSPSWNTFEGSSLHVRDDCASTQFKNWVGKQPELNVSSIRSIFETEPADSRPVRIPTIDLTTVDSDAGPSGFESPSEPRPECLADVCDITLRNPIKEENYEGMLWEPTRESLTPWSEEFTDNVTALEPSWLSLKVASPRTTINLNFCDEQNPGLVDSIGKEEIFLYSKNMEAMDTETRTFQPKKSESVDPFDSGLFKDLTNLSTPPRTSESSDAVK